MQRSIYKHVILDTIQATGDDVIVDNRILYINGVQMFKFDNIAQGGYSKVSGVSSVTAGVVTYTPLANPANSTQYKIQVTVANPGATGAQPNPLIFNVAVTTPSTGTLTATTLADQFRTALGQSPYTTYFTASGSGTLILTATSSYPVIVAASQVGMTAVQTTQGVEITGTPTTMALIGAGNNANTVWASGTRGTFAGTLYDLYFDFEYREIGETNTDRVNQGLQQCLWVNFGATNRSTFETALENVLAGGTKTSATTANPETIEVHD